MQKKKTKRVAKKVVKTRNSVKKVKTRRKSATVSDSRKTKKKEYKLSSQERYLDLFSRGIFGKNLKQFNGISLEEHYNGEWIKNEFGKVYLVSHNEEYIFKPVDHTHVDRHLMVDFKAIPGIAEITEINLKNEGYTTVKDLINHFKFKSHAETYMKSITERNGTELYHLLSDRFTSTNPALLYNSAYFKLNDVAFLDIETLGLHDCPLFLIGVATFEDGKIKIDQIFIDHILYEKAGLECLLLILKDKKAIFTFNGKSFDVPFIKKRLSRHDLSNEIKHPHFDVKYFSMKGFKDVVNSFELQTLENEILKFRRKEDVPGRLVPEFYESYLQSKNIGAIVPILNHNKQDLISTARIYHKLQETWIN